MSFDSTVFLPLCQPTPNIFLYAQKFCVKNRPSLNNVAEVLKTWLIRDCTGRNPTFEYLKPIMMTDVSSMIKISSDSRNRLQYNCHKHPETERELDPWRNNKWYALLDVVVIVIEYDSFYHLSLTIIRLPSNLYLSRL